MGEGWVCEAVFIRELSNFLSIIDSSLFSQATLKSAKISWDYSEFVRVFYFRHSVRCSSRVIFVGINPCVVTISGLLIFSNSSLR